MTLLTSTLLVCLALVLCWTVLVSVTRLQRLDRLHRRTDAARAGLAEALRRRAELALAVAAVRPDVADPLRAAVRAAEAAGPPGLLGSGREAAENTLGRRLAGFDRAGLPPSLRAELGDSEQLLTVARSVHNDAVRDTLVLRSRRLVRWFRLAGTAPMPAYFEIADAPPERPSSGPGVIRGTAGTGPA